MAQTAERLLLNHAVFDGNTAEVNTLKPTLEKIVKRFPVKRVIAVADCGLLSSDNFADLQAITLPGGGKLEFILAVPGRRYSEFVELLGPLHADLFPPVGAGANVLSFGRFQNAEGFAAG